MTNKNLPQEAIIIDAHLDLLYDVARKHRAGRRNILRDDYLDSFRQGGVTCIVSSLYAEGKDDADFLRQTMHQMAAFYDELDRCADFVQAFTAADIRRAKADGKIAVMLAFEGVEALCGNPDMLRAFYAMGVRIVGLCWSRPNWAADGSKFFDYVYQGHGITDGGLRLLEIAARLGMLIDVSHLNEIGFWQLMDIWHGPVIATHSNTRALSDTPRNLSDRQIEAIAKAGGVIGVNGASLLADIKNQAAADMGTLVAHMLHEKALGGAGCIGIGLDQCDRLIDDIDQALETRDIIPSHSMLGTFAGRLADAGFSRDELLGILGGNFLRAVEKAIG